VRLLCGATVAGLALTSLEAFRAFEFLDARSQLAQLKE